MGHREDYTAWVTRAGNNRTKMANAKSDKDKEKLQKEYDDLMDQEPRKSK